MKKQKIKSLVHSRLEKSKSPRILTQLQMNSIKGGFIGEEINDGV